MSLFRPDTQPYALLAEIDKIRGRQQERVEAAVKACEEANVLLKNAIANVEARKKEHETITEDVHRNLDALALVISLGKELHNPHALSDATKPIADETSLIQSSSEIPRVVTKV